jgi:hypothetical protein
MAQRTIFVPVGYSEAADRIAAMVERGVIRIQPHWVSREACQSKIDSLPPFQKGRYWPTAAVVRVAEEAQRLPTGAHADDRRCNRAARSLGASLAGDVARIAPIPPAEARPGRVSGNPIEAHHAA